MSRRISLLTAALLCTLALTTGCDGEADEGAMTDTDDAVQLSDSGEFYVEFQQDDGAVIGRNSFDIRLSVIDTVDPDSGGHPIYHVDVDVNAHMPVDGRSTGEPITVEGLDDGWYHVDGVVLDAEGTWQLDFAFGKGDLDDSISIQVEV